MMHQMKFVLWTKKYLGGNVELDFEAQYDETIPEDKKFNEYTPQGKVVLVVKDSIAAQYEIGKYYYFYSDKAEEWQQERRNQPAWEKVSLRQIRS
jgi:hypothetical protein